MLIDKTLDPKDAPVYQEYAKIMTWADKYRRLKIRTNADQPDQARNAVAFGAEGIGLCRTEHMFFGEGKIGPMREMILADTLEERKTRAGQAAAAPAGGLRGDLRGDGRPAGDHPDDRSAAARVRSARGERRSAQLAAQMGISYEKVHQRVESLHEFNPMLGFRGCRLGHHLPGDHRDAVPRDFRGGGECAGARHQGGAGDHDPAGRAT